MTPGCSVKGRAEPVDWILKLVYNSSGADSPIATQGCFEGLRVGDDEGVNNWNLKTLFETLYPLPSC